MRTRMIIAITLIALTLAFPPAQSLAHTTPALSMQHYTLCAQAALNASTLARVQTVLHARLLATPGILGAQAPRTSSRCLAVSVEATGIRKGAVEAAGKIGSVVIADGGPTHLTLGQHVRLVCPRPGCSTNAPVAKGNPAARPPILSVIVGNHDFKRGGAKPSFGEGGVAAVVVQLVPKAASRVCAFTRSHVRRYLAYVIDGSIASNPVLQSPICGGTVIFPFQADEKKAYVVAGYLNSGPLPVALRLQS